MLQSMWKRWQKQYATKELRGTGFAEFVLKINTQTRWFQEETKLFSNFPTIMANNNNSNKNDKISDLVPFPNTVLHA